MKRAVETINAVGAQPDFIVFTGDLTHTTDDAAVRRKRMAEFRRHRARPQGQGPALPARRARRGEGRGRRVQGALRRRRTTPSITRACTSSRSTTCPIPKVRSGRADRLARARISRRPAATRRIVVLTHRPLFDLLSRVGMVDEGRREGRSTLLLALPARHGLLRAHPPGASPHDRAHRAPRRAARWSSRCRRPARCRRRCRCLGSRRAVQGARLPARHRRRRAHRPHRAAGRSHKVARTASIFSRRPSCPHRPSCHRRRSCPRPRPQPFQMQSQRMRLPAIVHTPQLWQAVAWRQAHDATPLQPAGRS